MGRSEAGASSELSGHCQWPWSLCTPLPGPSRGCSAVLWLLPIAARCGEAAGVGVGTAHVPGRLLQLPCISYSRRRLSGGPRPRVALDPGEGSRLERPGSPLLCIRSLPSPSLRSVAVVSGQVQCEPRGAAAVTHLDPGFRDSASSSRPRHLPSSWRCFVCSGKGGVHSGRCPLWEVAHSGWQPVCQSSRSLCYPRCKRDR